MKGHTSHVTCHTSNTTTTAHLAVALGVVCGLLIALTGCVRRQLTIRSEPPGAQVFMNDTLKGQTPLTYDFEWYGGYRVVLQKEGYERIHDHKRLRAPIRFWIPFDLVCELLPFTIWDRRTWSYTLVPTTPLPTPSPPPLTTAPSAGEPPQE